MYEKYITISIDIYRYLYALSLLYCDSVYYSRRTHFPNETSNEWNRGNSQQPSYVLSLLTSIYCLFDIGSADLNIFLYLSTYLYRTSIIILRLC